MNASSVRNMGINVRTDRRLWGSSVYAGSPLQNALAALVEKRDPSEIVVVHHYTDNVKYLQLEIERRSKVNGIKFERIRLS